jgi:hypothetical protein
MKAEATPHRRRGRPATLKDKNRRSVPVRADRDLPLNWFFEDVPRAGFDEALLLSGDKRFYRLHDALHDDAYRHTSPGMLCRRFGVSLHDLCGLWQQYNVSLGMIRMANHLPTVMQDVAEESLSREESCPRCDGIGSQIGYAGGCPMCQGVGRVRVPGDPHSRRLLFKILHI